ncbi:DUF6230 family protein [Phytohabitans rumicis]|uniref:Cholesterol esterase n=1 Tax=Phytohabitans rumicis TaxID=1076125 RepID=A0A6V8LL88_9ACTN|nr:DUF6230 family protein [Phytohabitans rumicis]GFJ94936.1 cholesterol esterase [Phytohabitans rumicis]
MSATYRVPAAGRTQWRRFAVAVGVVTTVTAAVLIMISNGVLAAGFMVSGQQFKVSADTLDANGFVNYGWIDQHADGSAEPVAVAAMKHAELTNLCQSVLTTLPFVGDISLKLTAGAKTPVVAENMFVDMAQMDGNATFTNIEIGRDASTLDKGPPGAQGLQGLFSQQADKVHIDNLQQVAWSTNAGTFKLSGLRMKVSSGKDECF